MAACTSRIIILRVVFVPNPLVKNLISFFAGSGIPCRLPKEYVLFISLHVDDGDSPVVEVDVARY